MKSILIPHLTHSPRLQRLRSWAIRFLDLSQMPVALPQNDRPDNFAGLRAVIARQAQERFLR